MRSIAIVAAAIASAVAPTAAQTAPNRATRYLFQTDVQDGRAVWVNPAGTAAIRAASVYADVVVRGPGDSTRLAQITAGFSSQGLSFGYQYDDFDTVKGHTYRLGLAGSAGAFVVGAAAAYYRGNATDWGYDFGVLFRASRQFVLAVTAANIGEPVVRDVRQDFLFTPGVTVTPAGPALELSALGRFSGSSDGYSAGLRWRLPAPLLGALLARIDTDADLRRTGLAFGLAIGDLDQVGLVVTVPGDLSALDATSVYGVAARPMGGR